MSKCSGTIGYLGSEETQPGVWTPVITEKRYTGDLVRNNRRFSRDAENVFDDLTISNNISILSNKFMLDNLSYMTFISFNNSKWKINSVDINYPRIIITLGGLYNG